MRFAGQALGGGFSDLASQAGTTNFGAMSKNGIKSRMKERIAGHEAEAQVNGYGLKSIADIQAAEYGAEATKYQGQQAGQASMFGGLMNGISGIASAGIKQWGGGIGNAGVTTYNHTNPVNIGGKSYPMMNGIGDDFDARFDW